LTYFISVLFNWGGEMKEQFKKVLSKMLAFVVREKIAIITIVLFVAIAHNLN